MQKMAIDMEGSLKLGNQEHNKGLGNGKGDFVTS